MTSTNFDFIVVGAGPAGCVLATRLATSQSRPTVLLLEAGQSDGKDALSRIPSERYFYVMSERAKQSSWAYSTVPQEGLNGREIPYTRGNGLGGTSAINFSMWTIPPRDYHDDVAELTGNEQWRWEAAHERYQWLEALRGFSNNDNVNNVPADSEANRYYYSPRGIDHGSNGPVKCGVPKVLEDSLTQELDVWIDAGFPLNKDSNDGDPIGVSVCASTVADGYKSTAADVLDDAPSNLDIRTGIHVHRVLFDEDKVTARGVLTSTGQTFTASKEVILCAGSLDTPRILMHSGIGPADQLSKFNIPVVRHSPAIGQNLLDHVHAAFSLAAGGDEETETTTKPDILSVAKFYRSKEIQNQALEQWKRDRTGPMTDLSGALGLVYTKATDDSNIYTSTAFHHLPIPEKTFLSGPTIPLFEIMLNFPNFGYLFAPDKTPVNTQTYVVMLTCPQSRGQVTLQSSDPDVPLAMDPRLFSHGFDQHVAVVATRELGRVLLSRPEYARETTRKLMWPKGESDEEILEYWRASARSTWHMSGTVRMGQTPEQDGVDKDFKVWGTERLRVADLSVVPRLPVSHPQSVAYMIGLMAGDELVAEYNL